MSEKIFSKAAPKPVGSYPHARRAGNLLFLSGIGPRDPETDGVPGMEMSSKGNYTNFDFSQQVHSVFNNTKIILESAGAKWEDLVDITVFLTDMTRDFECFNAVYKTYFTEHQPCRTTVSINALPTPIAIELKCIAYLGD